MAKFLSFLLRDLLVLLVLWDKKNNNNNVVMSFQPLSKLMTTTTSSIVDVMTTARMSLANENAILKIQEEYRQMREKLRQGLLSFSLSLPEEGHDSDKNNNNSVVDPITFTQELLEKAADLAALQRYQQEEIIMEAQKELRHAQQDHVLADAMQHQAQEQYKMAQQQWKQLESFEDVKSGYEDQERLRDMSVAHAAEHMEHDAKELSLESQFHELEALDREDRAVEFPHLLERNEKELHDTLKAVRKYQNERAMEEWGQKAAPQHEQFLGILNTKFNNIMGHGYDDRDGSANGEISF
jgi:hypothetical protein